MTAPARRTWLLLPIACALAAGAVYIGPVANTPEILLQLRLPRVLLGFIVGMALAVAGTIFQGVLRNPLADPLVLGTSSGASLGVMIAGMLHLRSAGWLYLFAFAFSLATIAAVYRIAQTQGRTPVQTLILAGVVVSTFLNALVFLWFSLFYRESVSTLFFLLGTLTEGDPLLLRISATLVLLSSTVAWFFARDLNVLSQGDSTALHLGIDPERTRGLLFVLASLLVAAAVSVSGMIGFVGLIVPHLLRLIVGPDHRVLIPASAFGGALLLVWMDVGARTFAAPVEIPVGVVAALVGTPFFIYLLKKKKGDVF
jgi:iron complex transport system permease protein